MTWREVLLPWARDFGDILGVLAVLTLLTALKVQLTWTTLGWLACGFLLYGAIKVALVVLMRKL